MGNNKTSPFEQEKNQGRMIQQDFSDMHKSGKGRGVRGMARLSAGHEKVSRTSHQLRRS